MTKYQVFDGGKPADCTGHNVDPSWNKSIYDTYDEALKYAYRWLGIFRRPIPLNTPVDYSGYGDMIEIREISLVN